MDGPSEPPSPLPAWPEPAADDDDDDDNVLVDDDDNEEEKETARPSRMTFSHRTTNRRCC